MRQPLAHGLRLRADEHRVDRSGRAGRGRALYVKSNTRRGGFSQNINLDSVSGVFGRAIVFVTSTYNNQAGDYPPVFGPFTGVGSTSNVFNHVDNVKFTNVTVNGKPV